MDSDILIVGGGIAGSTLAALLCQNNVPCTVLEARDQRETDIPADTFDVRALAITRASANILQYLGTWSLLPKNAVGHFRRMQVWDADGSGDIEFDCRDLCEPTLGFIIEQARLEAALLKTCLQQENFNLQTSACIESLHGDEQSVTVVLANKQQYTARLLIGADGASSIVRNLAGINWTQHDYQQVAVAGIVNTENSHNDTARQVFLPDGPLAFLPLAEQNSSGFVWSTTPEQARELLVMDEKTFNKTLADAFEYRLGHVTATLTRAGYPLQHAYASQYCAQRLALVGDAAHVVHPLAGQGANLGLLDAATLAEVLLKAIGHGKDPGSHQCLRRYERWRKGENLLMLKSLQGLKELFASRSKLVCHLRNAGLDITDILSPLKHAIMRHAMGLSGDLPEFARKLN